MKSTVFFCDWLPPDFGAVGQYSLVRARTMAADGRRVVLYGLTTGKSSRLEEAGPGAGHLTVARIHCRAYDRSNFARRLLWTTVTNLKLVWAARRDLRAAETVVFTGSPPFMLHLLAPLNLVLRKAMIYRITDFYPECIIAAKPTLSRWLRPLLWLSNCWRRRMQTLEVLGDDQRDRLLEYGMATDRIRIVRDPSPVAITGREPPYPRPSALGEGKVLLYSGNLGVAHDWKTFVSGYERHHANGRGTVRLWLNATGAGADLLEKELRALGTPAHRTGLVPLGDVASLLSSVDAHLITLRDEFVGYVLPSKVYACVASGRPVLYVGSEKSDVYKICRDGLPTGSFFHANVGDGQQVAEHLEALGRLLARPAS